MTLRGGLFETMRSVLRSDTKASRKEACSAFVAEMKRNPGYIVALAEDYFYRNYERFDIEQTGTGHVVTVREVKQRIETKKRVEVVLEGMKSRLRSVIMLDLVLPCGKRLRHATFADCSKAGGWYAAVARHGKPSEAVDKKLTESDLRNIYTRFDKRLSVAA